MFDKILKNYSLWLNEQEHLKPHTKTKYLHQVVNFLAFLNAFGVNRLNDVNTDLITHFITQNNGKDLSKQWQSVRRVSLDLFFRWAYKSRYCANQVMVQYKQKKINIGDLSEVNHGNSPMTEFLTDSEQDELLSYVNNLDESFLDIRNRCIITLIMASGLFAEEVVYLNVNDIDLQKGTVKIQHNTNRIRVTPLNIALCEDHLKRWLIIRSSLGLSKSLNTLFVTKQGTTFTQRNLHKIISEALRLAGIRKTRHGANILRQTAIINMISKGMPIEEISQICGIKTLAILKTYADMLQNKS